MVLLLVFAITLVAAILLSELADRSILSTAVLFLLAGFAFGGSGLNWIPNNPREQWVQQVAQLALCSVLFTDGMRAGVRDLVAAWKLPGRALLLGLPLTLLATALLAHWLAGVSWLPAILVGAILCPTDPVFAAAIIGRDEIPGRLRFLLNVESGINDGIALPIVLALLEPRNKRVQHATAAFPEKRFPDASENTQLIKCQIACDAKTGGGQKKNGKTMPKRGRICVV
jgi:NhaP-type Na+/H+ or K+/H+ antiporter